MNADEREARALFWMLANQYALMSVIGLTWALILICLALMLWRIF